MASQQLVRWFGQESEPLRSKGIDDADPRVVMDAVMRRHLAEIKSDPAELGTLPFASRCFAVFLKALQIESNRAEGGILGSHSKTARILI